MNLLVYGANGWIGKQFTSFLDSKGISYTASKLRVDDTKAVEKEIRKGYTHVLCLVGRTSGIYNGEHINTIDYLEKPGNLSVNLRDNLFAPISLAIFCAHYNIHFTYLGTGCIFNYDVEHTSESNGWTENDLPNFFGSSYSTVKGYTDRLMHIFEDTALNLRIRMPITPENHPRNFISKITKYDKICSVPNSMTVLTDFFPVWLDLMLKWETGTYNCTNPGVITHNEILEMYRELVDKDFSWQNFDIDDQDKILASKRSNNYLATDKLSEYGIPSIHDSVRNVLKNWH